MKKTIQIIIAFFLFANCVFAQKEKIITLYDSEKTTNKKKAANFYNCYSKLLNCCENHKNENHEGGNIGTNPTTAVST